MTLPTVAQDNVIDEVVWVVGDEAILKSDVEQARMYFMMSGQQMEGEPYCVIPEQLAIQKLFLHQAAIDSIEVTEQASSMARSLRLRMPPGRVLRRTCSPSYWL